MTLKQKIVSIVIVGGLFRIFNKEQKNTKSANTIINQMNTLMSMKAAKVLLMDGQPLYRFVKKNFQSYCINQLQLNIFLQSQKQKNILTLLKNSGIMIGIRTNTSI
jgi:hypothetical protein